MGWTHTFNTNLVNSFKGSILVTDQTDYTGPANGFNPSNLGLPASLSSANPTYFNRFPLFNINSFQTLGSLTGLERGDNELSILDVLSFTHKNHTMRAGRLASLVVPVAKPECHGGSRFSNSASLKSAF